jgi:hypothetical protein
VTLSSSAISDYAYTVADASAGFTFAATEDSLNCESGDIVYSFTSSPAASFVTVDASSGAVAWSTSNQGDAGTFAITITGTITNAQGTYTTDYSFTLTVTGVSCATSTDDIAITAGTSSDQTFTVGESAAS